LIIRSLILISRAKDILDGNTSKQYLIDHLHIGYFTSIALVECTSAFFLLRIFASARRGSIAAASTSGVFKYLMRSTESDLQYWLLLGFQEQLHIPSRPLPKVQPIRQARLTALYIPSSASFRS
jgi:hypothetical protein